MNSVDSLHKDHTTIHAGIYGCPQHNPHVATYDLRFYAPNTLFISPAALHSVEHILATYFKEVSNFSDEVIAVCPGACQTMFYVLLSSMHCLDLRKEIISAADYALKLTFVPGATKETCGNYKLHDLKSAQFELQHYAEVISNLPASAFNIAYKVANNL